MSSYDLKHEPNWQKSGRPKTVLRQVRLTTPVKILCARCFPTLRSDLYGTCQKLQWAMLSPVSHSTGLQCLAPDGLGRIRRPRKCCHGKKCAPRDWTYKNIDTMREQLKSMGLAIDWSREFATCDPSYYKHEQAMFLDFLEAGLVERRESIVNWDPVDQTVLAMSK